MCDAASGWEYQSFYLEAWRQLIQGVDGWWNWHGFTFNHIKHINSYPYKTQLRSIWSDLVCHLRNYAYLTVLDAWSRSDAAAAVLPDVEEVSKGRMEAWDVHAYSILWAYGHKGIYWHIQIPQIPESLECTQVVLSTKHRQITIENSGSGDGPRERCHGHWSRGKQKLISTSNASAMIPRCDWCLRRVQAPVLREVDMEELFT